jgi:hypothetical protein
VPPAGRLTPSRRESTKSILPPFWARSLPAAPASSTAPLGPFDSARIYHEDKRDLPRWVEISGQHVEVLTAILEDVPQRQKLRVGVSCRVEVCILGQHILSASLLHAMSRVVDVRRLWGHPSESWFIQKVSNAPLNSFAIR